MITKNIQKMLVAPLTAVNIQGNNVSCGTSGTGTGWVNIFSVNPTFTKSITRTSGTSDSGKYFDVGFGDTTPTADDYKLASGNMNIVLGSNTVLEGQMKLDHISTTQNTKSAGQIDNFTVTLKNNTNETVTVKEVGVYCQCGQVSTSNNRYCLIMRKVLATPIVFAPGDVYAITYSLSLSI